MIIEEIVSILNNSDVLISLLGGEHIYPYQTDYLGECVIFQITPQTDNKAHQTMRVQLSSIAKTISKAITIEKVLKQLLLTKGDEPLTDNILQVEANGGGSLYDYNRQMYHHYIFIDIINRSELV